MLRGPRCGTEQDVLIAHNISLRPLSQHYAPVNTPTRPCYPSSELMFPKNVFKNPRRFIVWTGNDDGKK